jgi:uncharacterized protein YggE
MRTAAALLAVTALAACAPREADPRGVDRNEVLLQVSAMGETDTRPDQARFTAGVNTTAPSAAAASARNNEVMNKVTAALKQLGVKDDDIQTRQISLQRIEYGSQKGQYQASNMVEVRVRDLKTAGQAISVTTEAGANVLSGPNMTIADPEAATRSAYANAYKAARARAQTYADAADMKISRVLTIRDGGGGYVPIPYYGGRADGMAVEQSAANVSPPMHPGMTTNQVSVRVDFALKPK